jgi:ubiquinone/menaquinone biosynthesis C-methylase UbiE
MESTAFKIGDSRSYDSVADTFDSLTDRFSSPIAQHLVELADLGPSDRVLDIGTGTGVVALYAAERLSVDGAVAGIDLSEGMLTVARDKSNLRGLSERVRLLRMDVESLGFAAESFDAVVSLFALLHFPDPLVALREMHRVLRPRGRLVVGVGSGPPWLSWSGWWNRLSRLPEMLRVVTGKDLVAPRFLNGLVYKHLPEHSAPEESHLASTHANRSGVLPALVHQAGFREVRTHWLGTTAVLAKPEDFWELQATFSSIARKRLGAATPPKVQALRAEFFDNCRERQRRGGRLLFPLAALIVSARRAQRGDE